MRVSDTSEHDACRVGYVHTRSVHRRYVREETREANREQEEAEEEASRGWREKVTVVEGDRLVRSYKQKLEWADR